METKNCEYCKKEINFISNKMYDGIIIFCDDTCMQDYINEYIKDNSNDILNSMGDR